MGGYENLAGTLFVIGALPLLTGAVVEKYKRNHTGDAIVTSTAFISAVVFFTLGWAVLFLIAVCIMFAGGVYYLKKVIADERRGSRDIHGDD